MIGWYRNEHIPSACPHLVFYIPFFMPGVWITKPNPEAIVGTEAGEQFCLCDCIHNPVTYSGSIIKNKEFRHTSDIVKDVL